MVHELVVEVYDSRLQPPGRRWREWSPTLAARKAEISLANSTGHDNIEEIDYGELRQLVDLSQE
jgi:hypothetical protein